ncbi:MAG: hypothetical protein FWC43_11320 [Planctomycetaceae bacterium]|nr:hypothetical protein [Planctomycetaceae bacterium]
MLVALHRVICSPASKTFCSAVLLLPLVRLVIPSLLAVRPLAMPLRPLATRAAKMLAIRAVPMLAIRAVPTLAIRAEIRVDSSSKDSDCSIVATSAAPEHVIPVLAMRAVLAILVQPITAIRVDRPLVVPVVAAIAVAPDR